MWWCVNEQFPYCKALEELGFAVTWKRPAVRARCTRCTSTAEGGMFYTFVVRLRSLFFCCCGWRRFEATFPTSVWEGHSKGWTEDGGEGGQWAKITQFSGSQCSCVGLHFCLVLCRKEKKSFGQTPTAPAHLQSYSFSQRLKETGRKKIGERKKLEPQVSEWERKEGLKAALSINPARFLLAWPRGYKLILLRFGFPQCLPPERVIKVALQKAGSSPWHIYQEQESY